MNKLNFSRTSHSAKPPAESAAGEFSRRSFLRAGGAVAAAALCPLCGGLHSAASAAERMALTPQAASVSLSDTNAGKFFPSSRMPEAVRARLATRLFGDFWLRDDEFEHYHETLAKRVSAKDDFLIVSVNYDSVNAFAHFGGIIGMLGGLWLFCRNESEYAAILAHEMAHVKQEHFKRREEQSKETSAILIPIILGGLLVDDPETREALTIGGLGLLGALVTGYTREMEQEADAVAVSLMRKGGFHPRALAAVLGRFQGGGGVEEYQRTHPAPGRRSASVTARIKAEDAEAVESADFYFLREKLRAGFKRGEKEQRRRTAELKSGRGDLDHLRYAVLILAGQTRDKGLGAEMSEELADAARSSAVVGRAVAENMASRGETESALELLDSWRSRELENPAPLGEEMRILSRLKRDAEALALYEGAPEVLRNRATLIRRAATAADNLGDAKAANVLLARAALRDGRFERALRQLKVADREAKSDPQTLLEIGKLRKTAQKELKNLPRDQ